MRDKVARQCPQTTTFEKERRAEADSNRSSSAYQPNALPLGQTGSRSTPIQTFHFYYPPPSPTILPSLLFHSHAVTAPSHLIPLTGIVFTCITACKRVDAREVHCLCLLMRSTWIRGQNHGGAYPLVLFFCQRYGVGRQLRSKSD